MSELLPDQARAMRNAAAPLAGRWVAVHRMGAQIGHMARLAPERFEGDLAEFPARIERAPEAVRLMAEQSLEDIEALLRTGFTALEVIARRGDLAPAGVQNPALALWREFYKARAALLGLPARDRCREPAGA
jgi:hypothetical protein